MLEDPSFQTLSGATAALVQQLKPYPLEEREKAMEALYASGEFHASQRRKSGHLFVMHPVQVAALLAQLRCDLPTIQAGLLHDVLEDTATPAEALQRRFGQETYQLVEAVTHQKMFSTKEFLEKVLAKSHRDPRVAAIKIADRTVNLLNYGVFSLEKHQAFLEETEGFYLGQLAEVVDVPKELVRALGRAYQRSLAEYQGRL